MKQEMKPLSEVMNSLRKKGYTADFSISEDSELISRDTNEAFKPEDLVIVQTYRFEGESDPGDMCILFAIEANSGTKGLCIDAYGTNASRTLGEFMKEVKILEREI